MVGIFRLSETQARHGQDNFFLWSMVILPFVAQGAYIFDAFYYLTHRDDGNGYEGLFSTIMIVFTYLRYCSPIESRKSLAVYYMLLCLLSEVGSIAYMATFIIKKDAFFTVVYAFWALIELVMTVMLIYCRVYKRYEVQFKVENKHLFHFMSRLEIILAIFIPFFVSRNFTTLTKDSIAFFLLFDFFSESYARFQGVWIKSTLYLFVATVTLAVAAEWLYFAERDHSYEQVSAVSELVSAVLCNILIILQFFPYHFTTDRIEKMAREGFAIQKRLSKIAVENGHARQVTQVKAEQLEVPSVNEEVEKDDDGTTDSYC